MTLPIGNKFNPKISVIKLKAFTLIEMLLVLVLLSVATAFALPNIGKTFNQVQLQSTVDKIIFSMKYAQSLAITKNQEYRLIFLDGFKSYQVEERTNEEKQFKTLNNRWGKKTPIPTEITLTCPTEFIGFKSNGQIDRTQIKLCLKKSCAIIATDQQRGQIEVYDET